MNDTNNTETVKANVARTAAREYFIILSRGVWYPYFKAINPKTGKTWQSTRRCSPYQCTSEAEAVAAITSEQERSGK
jgi:hypothetical protein